MRAFVEALRTKGSAWIGGTGALFGLSLWWGAASLAGQDQPAAKEVASPQEIVATWEGGRLERSQYDRWLVAKDLEPSQDSLRELVYVRSLADAAEAGLDEAGRQRVDLEVEARRHRVLLAALRKQVARQVEVRQEELERLLEDHPQAFVRPRKLFLRNLFKRHHGDAERARQEIADLRRQVLEGASFEVLARRESDSQSRFRGGLLGFVDPEGLPPAVAAAVRDLKPGELSEPVIHGGGVTIFLCEKVREGERPGAEEVRAKLRANLERQRGDQAWQEMEATFLEEAVLHPELISRLASPSPPPADTTLLSLPGYRLGLRQGAMLLALGEPGRELSSFAASEVEELLRQWAVGVAGSRRAAELGLTDDEEIAAELSVQRLEVLARRELVRRVDERLEEPREEELRRWYEAHPRAFRQLPRYEVAAIQFAATAAEEFGPDAQEAVAQALDVVARVERGELSFQEAARRYSVHASAADGGDLGWRDASYLVEWGPVLTGALRSLEAGEQTGLLRLESGLWSFLLQDRRPARTRPFEESVEIARKGWERERIKELEGEVRRQRLEEISPSLVPRAVPDESGVEAGQPGAPKAEDGPLSAPDREGPASAAEPVVLRWSTATEFERYGYHVYRGRRAEGPFQRLTDEAIPGGGTTDLPQSYRFEDSDVEAGEKYFYYVESVSSSGQRSRLTPVQAIEARPRNLAAPGPRGQEHEALSFPSEP